ncbi:TPA: hypothetical protein NJ546_001745 [Vibrio parahaemolyticus]|nr:hypothetical protein [Vibrio parahaemolyticus]HCG9712287.1 hypothetical protein [Vibrio parahaemolyticus]
MSYESFFEKYIYDLSLSEPDHSALNAIHVEYIQTINELSSLGVFQDLKYSESVCSDFVRFKVFLSRKYAESNEDGDISFDLDDIRKVRSMNRKEKFEEYLKNKGLA